jgi:hypothetical protein
METINLAKAIVLVVLLVLVNVLGAVHIHAQVSEGREDSPRSETAKITLGAVEDVILRPWGVSFPARIDTGADLSSLDARDIVVRDDVVAFKLGKRYGGLQLQLPIVEWRYIQTATGTEIRPVVEISLCLGPKLFLTLATLKDRSEMLYPFLVGRSALKGNFLVDPSRTRAAQPTCSAAALASGGIDTIK